MDKLKVGGVFHIEHIRDGEVIDREEIHNLVVGQGLDHILNTEFLGSAQVSAAATETTAYNEGARQAFSPAASAGGAGSVTNSANKATFTMNAAKTIYGAFLASAQAQGATTGVLFSAARFASSKSVSPGDQLLLTYTFNAASQ